MWRRSLPGTPPYLVPDPQGSLDAPSLSAFYMFFTMIILLQVEVALSSGVSVCVCVCVCVLSQRSV